METTARLTNEQGGQHAGHRETAEDQATERTNTKGTGRGSGERNRQNKTKRKKQREDSSVSSEVVNARSQVAKPSQTKQVKHPRRVTPTSMSN